MGCVAAGYPPARAARRPGGQYTKGSEHSQGGAAPKNAKSSVLLRTESQSLRLSARTEGTSRARAACIARVCFPDDVGWIAIRSGKRRVALLAVELNGDREMDSSRFAIQLRRLILPLLDGFQRRLMEHSGTRNNRHGADTAVGINERINLDRARNVLRAGA